MVLSAEAVMNVCGSLGCHAPLESSPTWPLMDQEAARVNDGERMSECVRGGVGAYSGDSWRGGQEARCP